MLVDLVKNQQCPLHQECRWSSSCKGAKENRPTEFSCTIFEPYQKTILDSISNEKPDRNKSILHS